MSKVSLARMFMFGFVLFAFVIPLAFQPKDKDTAHICRKAPLRQVEPSAVHHKGVKVAQLRDGNHAMLKAVIPLKLMFVLLLGS